MWISALSLPLASTAEIFAQNLEGQLAAGEDAAGAVGGGGQIKAGHFGL